MPDDDLLRAARAGFLAAQKRAGTADIVARVRRMPDGTIDLLWERRVTAQNKLRLGSIGGHAPALSKVGAQLDKRAEKGHFYAVVITTMDDSDARLIVVPKGREPIPQ